LDEGHAESAEKGGLTRRQLLQRGAVVGGVVWATPVIDSVITSAAAASAPPVDHHHVVTFPTCGPNCPSGGFDCSAGFVVFQKTGDTHFYVIKIDQCTSTCFTDCGLPQGGTFQTMTCNGHTFSGPSHDIVVDTGIPPTVCDAANCANDFTFSGNTITAKPGITIVFYAAHDGSFGAPEPQWASFCP
jgi:hypothetical protein